MRATDELQKELDTRGIALTLFSGQEVRINGELLADIAKDEMLFVDEGQPISF